MKIKTSELTGAALDWAVANIMGTKPASFDYWKQTWPHYSTYWARGGPIIDRERIGTNYYGNLWHAEFDSARTPQESYTHTGKTLLIAAMRCYVASKLGDEIEIEIPEELCTKP